MYYNVSCEELGLDCEPTFEKFRTKEQVYTYLRKQGYSIIASKYAVENGEYENTYDRIIVERVCEGRARNDLEYGETDVNEGRRRKRREVIEISTQVMSALVHHHPKGISKSNLLNEISYEISARTLDRYVADLRESGFVDTNRGVIALSRFGTQCFIREMNQAPELIQS